MKTRIEIKTKVNGYVMDLEDEGYMYYDLESLLEGMFVHVGMNRLESLTKDEIKTLLNATKDGSIVKKLQAEVNELKATISEQKKLIRNQKSEIKALKAELKIED